MPNLKQDQAFMAYALQLAQRGNLSSAPMVGCVIAKNNKIIGQGWQSNDQQFNAANNAFDNCQENMLNAELYLTMEPDFSQDNAQQLSQSLLQSQISRVIIGCQHLLPEHCGKMIAQFEQCNIKVTHGVLSQESAAINADYVINHQQFRPKVIWLMDDISQQFNDLTTSDQFRLTFYLTDLFKQANAMLIEDTQLNDNVIVAALLATVPFGDMTLPKVIVQNQAMTIDATVAALADYQGAKGLLTSKQSQLNASNDDEIVISCEYCFDQLNPLLQHLFEQSIKSLLIYSSEPPSAPHKTDHFLTLSSILKVGIDPSLQFKIAANYS